MRVEAKLALISLCVIGLAASCGGRSGIELAEYEDLLDASASWGGGPFDGGKKDGSGPDTSVGGSGGSGGITPDGSPVDSDVPDGIPPQDAVSDYKDFFDTLPPLPEGGPIGECTSCLQGQCGDKINACYNDSVCWSGIQCAVPKCFMGGAGGSGGGGGGGGGGLDLACLMECFGNNMSSMMTALQMFQCITGTCGDLCGLSGGGGAGGAGGGMQYGQFHFYDDPSVVYAQPGARYIGAVRVPEPEECRSIPWLHDVLQGRTPNPLPPSARR